MNMIQYYHSGGVKPNGVELHVQFFDDYVVKLNGQYCCTELQARYRMPNFLVQVYFFSKMNTTRILFVSYTLRRYATKAMAASEASEKIWSSLHRVFDKEKDVCVLDIGTSLKNLRESFQFVRPLVQDINRKRIIAVVRTSQCFSHQEFPRG